MNEQCRAARNSINQYIEGIVCDENDVLGIEIQKAQSGLPVNDVVELIGKLLAQDRELSLIHISKGGGTRLKSAKPGGL